jgi:hypothetical protein
MIMARRARRHHGAPVTFFSFQDIILSVTGILILVTLLLTLELATRAELVTQTPVQMLDPAQINAQVATVERRRAALQEEVQGLERLLAEVGKAQLGPTGSIEELRGALTARRAAVARLQQEAESLDAAAEGKREGAGAIRAASAELEAEAVKLEASARAAAAELANQVPTNRLFFLPGQGDGKRPLIVECSAKQVRVGQPNEKGELVELASWAGADGVHGFSQWVRSRDAGREYLVLFARPDGTGQYERAHLQLARLGFDVGWDAIPEDVVLFAERPAREGAP